MRLMFADMYTEEEKGIRTKKIVDLLAKKISELDSEIQSAEKLAKKVLEAAGIKLTEKNGKAETGALFLLVQNKLKNWQNWQLLIRMENLKKRIKRNCRRH